jgi:membrane-bound lytic murein transglycosylase B
MEKTPKTLKEALEQGYRNGRTAWSQGYLSRVSSLPPEKMPIMVNGRTGELFYCVPSWRSTRYHHRQYLTR